MNFRIAKVFLALVLLAIPVTLRSESFHFKNGRFADGKVLEIELTPAQAKQIASHFKPGMIIHLTKAQQSIIRAQAKVKKAPTKIEVYRPEDIANDCTCAAANYGFPFKPGWLELPVDILCSDQEAKAREIVD
jgi:hypothetical protein